MPPVLIGAFYLASIGAARLLSSPAIVNSVASIGPTMANLAGTFNNLSEQIFGHDTPEPQAQPVPVRADAPAAPQIPIG